MQQLQLTLCKHTQLTVSGPQRKAGHTTQIKPLHDTDFKRELLVGNTIVHVRWVFGNIIALKRSRIEKSLIRYTVLRINGKLYRLYQVLISWKQKSITYKLP